MDDETHAPRRKEETDDPPRNPESSTDMLERIQRLASQGFGTRRIATMLGIGRKKVRSVLARTSTPPPTPTPTSIRASSATPTAASLLDSFRETIKEKVAKSLTVSRILREIREQGYQGGRTILADYIREIRAPLAPKKKVRRRFETAPGEEIQVDWSPYQVSLGGRQRTVHAFGAVLAYSRKAFIRFFFDERQSTLLEAHLQAFADFGGVTQRVVYDRMATVVLGTIGRDHKPLWHPRFLDFARHHGYDPFLCRVRDPDRKGEIEKFFLYLERDFVQASSFGTLEEMNAAVRGWLDRIANQRVHGTTQRVPDEAWLEEKPFLIGLPSSPFPAFDEELRQVGVDATISVRGTTYTVPARLAHHKVAVRLYSGHFEVLDGKGEVAMVRAYVSEQDKGRLVIDPSHYEGVRPRGQCPGGSVARMEDLFLGRFPTLAELLAGIKVRMKALFHIHLRSLWRTAEEFGEQAFLEAAERAQGFRRFDALAVRRILEQNYPLPEHDPVLPLGAEARATCQLGDVDGGSLDDYAHLDGDPADGTTDDDAADGSVSTEGRR